MGQIMSERAGKRWRAVGLVALTASVLMATTGCSSDPRMTGGGPRPAPAPAEASVDISAPIDGATVQAAVQQPEVAQDPRCEAVRAALVRPAASPDAPAAAATIDTLERLRSARQLATGEAASDLDAVIAFTKRWSDSPASVTALDVQVASDAADRLIPWAVRICPRFEYVWGCSVQSQFNPVTKPAIGGVDDGMIRAAEAVEQWYGTLDGKAVELGRDHGWALFGWLDDRGLVVRRVRVLKQGYYWVVGPSAACASKWVPDAREVQGTSIDVEGPDPPAPDPGAVTTTAVPPPPKCGFDPDNRSDEYETLGEYVGSGHAEPGCWDLLGPEGHACLEDPPMNEPLACFDLE